MPSLVIAGRDKRLGCRSRSETHGGFDNDVATLNSILFRILGQRPPARVSRCGTCNSETAGRGGARVRRPAP